MKHYTQAPEANRIMQAAQLDRLRDDGAPQHVIERARKRDMTWLTKRLRRLHRARKENG